MKSFFDEQDYYTDKALEFEGEVSRVLEPIIKKWHNDGYSTRQMQVLVNNIVFDEGCKTRLGKDKQGT